MFLEYLKNLYDSELYEDVKLLSFKEDPTLTNCCQIYYIHADAHFQTQDYHSALKFYRNALQTRSLVKGRGRKGVELRSERDVKYLQYQCYIKLKMYKEALAVLESIPGKIMTVAMKIAKAKLLTKLNGDEGMALGLYREVMQQQPLSFTAIQAYLLLGGKVDEVMKTLETHLKANSDLLKWVTTWTKAQALGVGEGEWARGGDMLNELSTRGTTVNTQVMSQAAYMYFLMGNYEKALELFKWIRDNNSLQYNHLDCYAFILYHNTPSCPVLESLATKSQYFPDNVVEAWIINGYYHLSFDRPSKAFFFAQKALQLDLQNFEALLLAGISLSSQSDYVEALVHLRLAIQTCTHRYEPYYYVAEIYWKTDRKAEARAVAFDYQQQFPSSRSYTLHASVLIKDKKFSIDTYQQAQMLLRKALFLDSENLNAIELLVRVIQSLNGDEEAVEFLEEHSPKKQVARYHKLLASIYLKIKGKKVKALDHIIVAKRLDLSSASRKSGAPLSFFQEDSSDGEMEQLSGFSKVEEIFLDDSSPFVSPDG